MQVPSEPTLIGHTSSTRPEGPRYRTSFCLPSTNRGYVGNHVGDKWRIEAEELSNGQARSVCIATGAHGFVPYDLPLSHKWLTKMCSIIRESVVQPRMAMIVDLAHHVVSCRELVRVLRLPTRHSIIARRIRSLQVHIVGQVV